MAHDNYIPIGRLCLFLSIDYGYDDLSWDVKINCKNIREYKQFLGLSHEEIDQIVLSRKRDDKINSIVE